MAGVYISFPFCSQKCTFCNFASGVMPAGLQAEYDSALLSEIESVAWPWVPDTIYIGGGTPSQMELASFGNLAKAIPGRPWREFTIEAAPGSLASGTPGRDRVRAWADSGVNRVSLGVQSFAAAELRQTGRRHDRETVMADCHLLREAGIQNVSIDLIAGLPHQTLDTWRDSLQSAIDLDVPHVSVYLLEVDEDSRLGLEILQGGSRYGAATRPDDDSTAVMYEMAVELLNRAGIGQYEISNFAKPGFESVHNLKYWTGEPYLGFGADAHSFDGRWRWSNPETASEYVKAWRNQSPVTKDREQAEPEERYYLGLRLMRGVHMPPADAVRFGPQIERLRDAELVEVCGAQLKLTGRGALLSNEVFQEFLPAL